MSENEIKKSYHINLPYPEVKVEKENVKYAHMLLCAYSGMVSEFTAIDQYLYHKFKVFQDFPEVSNALSEIAKVEMHHLDILGTLIELLGGDPRYFIKKKDKHYYWDGKFVAYGCCLKDYLKNDMASENAAIRDYKKLIEEIKDPYIIAIIKRIILDEELHIEIFTNLYNEYIGC